MIPLFIEATDTALVTALKATLGAFNSAHGLPIKNPLFFSDADDLILNNPADDQDDTYDVEDVIISSAYDFVSEPNADRDGSLAGEPREVQKIIRISGWVRARSLAHLNDKIAALNKAFNPNLNYLTDYVSSEFDIGFLPLQFNVPTEDTTTWPNGYSTQQYYVRSTSLPVSLATKFDDYNARFRITLLCVDPRKYESTTQSANRTGSGGITVNNSAATYPSWPTIEIAFTNAPVADFTIKRDDAPAFGRVLSLESSELSDAAGKTLIINMQARTAKYSTGTDKTAAIKATSRFWDLLPQSQTVTVALAPADAVFTITWQRAFV